MPTAVNFLTEHVARHDEDVETHSALGLLTNDNELINGLSRSLQSDYEVSQAIIQQSKFPIPRYAWKTGVYSEQIKTTDV